MEDVDVWATEFRDEILGKNGPENKPWGMYEFAMSDPDETLVRDAVAFRSQWTAISSYSDCIHLLVDVLNEPAGARLPPTLSPGYAPGPFLLTARASIAMTTVSIPRQSRGL